MPNNSRHIYDALIVHHIFINSSSNNENRRDWPDDSIHGLIQCLSKHTFDTVLYVDKKWTNKILVDYLDRYENGSSLSEGIPIAKTSKIFWTGYQWPYCTHDNASGSINYMLQRGYGIHSSPCAIFDGDFKHITSEDLLSDKRLDLHNPWKNVYDDVYFID